MAPNDKLKQWMDEQGHDYRSIADATGDTYSAVHMMVNGKREISDGFKWRFATAFTQTVAESLFGEKPKEAATLQAEHA